MQWIGNQQKRYFKTFPLYKPIFFLAIIFPFFLSSLAIAYNYFILPPSPKKWITFFGFVYAESHVQIMKIEYFYFLGNGNVIFVQLFSDIFKAKI